MTSFFSFFLLLGAEGGGRGGGGEWMGEGTFVCNSVRNSFMSLL